MGLGNQGVNGVNDDVRFRLQQFFRIGGRVEAVDGDDFRLRVDLPEAGGHGFRLGLADRGFQSVDLPVGIGDAEVVQVHQDNGADARPRQGFRRPGAYAANADDGHAGVPEDVQPAPSIQAAYAAESGFIVHGCVFEPEWGIKEKTGARGPFRFSIVKI